MSQQSTTFDYLNESVWGDYFNGSIIPLAQSADLLLRCSKEAVSIFRGHAVTDFENDESIKQILLGGVKTDRTLSERSLYNFYRSFVGLYYDHEKYVTEVTAGVRPTDVTIEIMYPPLMVFVRWVKEICKYILTKTGKEIPTEQRPVQDILKNPQLLVDEIKKFHEHAINFTAGYNPATFFVWSLRKNTRKHLNLSYSGLEAEERFAKIQNFLGLVELFRPDMADPSKYVVFGFPEYGDYYSVNDPAYKLLSFSIDDMGKFSEKAKSVGGLICYLNELIWAYFQHTDEKESGRMSISMLLQNLPNIKMEYFNRAVSSMNEKPLVSVSYRDSYEFRGLSVHRKGSTSIPSIALTEALDSISEHQFLGVIEYQLQSFDNGKTGTLYIEPRRG